ncbi:hypothetical protein [Kitasatospora sp. NPDC004289]
MRVSLRFAAVRAELHRAAARGLELGMEHVLTEANKTVPLDESTLERSVVSSTDDIALKGAVSYDTPYAVRQHEELTYRHAPGRRAKWLELAAIEEAPVVLALIAAELRRATRGGRGG